MSKKELTIRLMNPDVKGSVVRFDYYGKDVEREDRERQLVQNIYIDKEVVKDELGLKLSKARGVEVTVRILMEKKSDKE